MTTISHYEVSDIDASPPRGRVLGFAARERVKSQRIYRKAMRHSRAVRTVRLAIPLTVVLGIGTAVIGTWFNPLRALTRLPIDVNGVVVSGTKITMQQPRMAGFTHDARPYLVTARGATQDLLVPDMLDLDTLHSIIEMRDRSKFDLTAKRGLYDTKTQKMTLQSDVVVVTPTFRALLNKTFINIPTGYMLTEQPVEVQTATSTINANRMEMLNSGEVIRFERGVTMVIKAAARTEGR